MPAVTLNLDFDPPARACIACGGAIEHWGVKHAYGNRFDYDRCARCGLVFVNPRPSLRALGHFYENYASLTGAVAAPECHAIPRPAPTEAQRRFIRHLLRLRPGPGRFLDVGSGRGLATAAAHECGLTVTALESQSQWAAATRTLPGVTVIPTLFEDYQHSGAPFDYILMSHVLEHTHDPRSFLAKGAGLLSPGGLLWILLPNLDSLYRRILGTRDPYFIPPTHLNHFNPASLARLCRHAGLEVVQSTDYHDLPLDVLSKRFKSPQMKKATRALAVVANQTLRLVTDLSSSGAFVSCCARKPLA